MVRKAHCKGSAVCGKEGAVCNMEQNTKGLPLVETIFFLQARELQEKPLKG